MYYIPTVIDNLVHIYNTDTQQMTPAIGSRMDGKVTLTILLFTMTYAAGHGMKQRGPSGAQFIASANIVINTDLLSQIPDPTLTFFRDVLQFTEQEIETATQSAIEYFNTTFGLDFSESVPDSVTLERRFQNASMYPSRLPFNYTVQANRWLAAGKKRSKSFDHQIGFFGVRFLDDQILHGTYGGLEGRRVGPGPFQDIFWGYSRTNTRPPMLIQYQSTSPSHTSPDGIVSESSIAFHPSLGQGIILTTIVFTPIDETTAQIVAYDTVVFPAEPLI